jgi:hypothetical protein
MVTVDEPVALPTCVTAEIVATVLDVTTGAVYPPEADMAPMLALQFTALVAVPLAKALHVLFPRDWIVFGEQLTVIAVSGVTVTVALPVFVLS